MTGTVRMVTAEEVAAHLDMATCIELMRGALISLEEGSARQIVRPVLPLEGHNVLGMMPAYSQDDGVVGVKVLTVYPSNFERGIPSHQGCIVVFDAASGAISAIVDAESVTAIRTAAASAAATDALARRDASRLAILGAGLQGRQHLEAIRVVREVSEVTVWDLHEEAAQAFAVEMSARTGLPVRPCTTAAQAVEGADIICTVTPAREPILSGVDVPAGAHINAVGACTPDARELAGDLMAAGKIFVDWKPAALLEAGDYILAREEGLVTEDDIEAQVGGVLSGQHRGREREDEITIFEALGQATQDLAAANHVVKSLQRLQGRSSS